MKAKLLDALLIPIGLLLLLLAVAGLILSH